MASNKEIEIGPIPLVSAPEFMGQVLTGMEVTGDYLDMAGTANTFDIHSTPLDGFVERFFASGKM